MKLNFLFILYLLLPQWISQKFWSYQFVQFLSSLNVSHNNKGRDTYNPDDYKGGENFDSNNSRLLHLEGQFLEQFMHKKNPERILEMGPGSGFFSRQIIEYASVTEYVSLEVNTSFSRYLEKTTASYDVISHHYNTDYKKLNINTFKSDTIVAIECFHHMHDRQEFLKTAIKNMPNLQGIVFHDPTHYLPRILRLLKKLPRYIRSKTAQNDKSWSTHHFLTIGEFRSLEKSCPNISITFQPCFGPRFAPIAKVLMTVEQGIGWKKDRYPLSRYFMTSMSGIITIPK
ncbi:class I SAM-dependent methyltransferase [Alphaproteobacteria bacterium]|nr:class I SAM-dependent methyltransferase [Alphaproteobacteria bacterium]